MELVGAPRHQNDRVDIALLYAVSSNAVDFLITQDQGIHERAHRANVYDRVLSVEEALVLCRRLGPPTIPSPMIPALEVKPVYKLSTADPFFDSLRDEYDGFDDWWQRICREGRQAWVYLRGDDSIGALLIPKIEDEAVPSEPLLPRKKRLKICTMKVTHTGYKIGELFIKLAVRYCQEHGLSEMYLTHFKEPSDPLVQLISRFGFERVARLEHNGRFEEVYLKQLWPQEEDWKSLSPLEISRRYYPSFYDGQAVRKFVVPIRPDYHSRLFIEWGSRQATLEEWLGKLVVEGNTIDKAYLSHSRTRKIRPGDLLLFYRSQDRKEVTSLGVVQEVHRNLQDPDEIIKLVGKRTVYTVDEIRTLAKKPILLLLFRWHFHFRRPIPLQELCDAGVFKMAPQTITQIDEKAYSELRDRGGIDARFVLH